MAPFNLATSYNLMKQRLTASAYQQILNLVARNPEKNLVTLCKILERVTKNEDYKRVLRQAQVIFQDPEQPATRYAHRILRECAPIYRKKGILNLFINAIFLGRTAREEFGAREGIEVPFFIVISPTMACNLACTGCYAGKYGHAHHLEPELVDRLITEAKEMGMYFITISGGEPFCYPALLDLFAKHDDMAFLVYTNGTLIDRPLARRLVELGNVAPAISLEGFEAETDARRGPGMFAKVMQAMDNLREEGAIFGFSATATRQNTEIIGSEKFIQMLIDKGAAFGWYFTFVPVGEDADTSLMPTPEQRHWLHQQTTSFRLNYPIFVGDFWNDGELVGGCMAGGRLYLHINAKGDVEPCVFAHFAVDNVREKSLLEALKSPFFEAFRKRQPYTENHYRPCAIIDNPEVLRQAVAEGGAHPTHPGAEAVITTLAQDLDHYAQAYAAIADPFWAEKHPATEKADTANVAAG